MLRALLICPNAFALVCIHVLLEVVVAAHSGHQAVEIRATDILVDTLAAQGVIAGVAMSRLNPHAGMDNVLITCATEMNTDEDIAAYVAALKKVLS